MSSSNRFVGAAPVTPQRPVANDDWWPDIDVEELHAGARLDGNVTPARLRAAIANAVLVINNELLIFKARHLAAGRRSLDDVPAAEVDGQHALVTLYLRAVSCAVQADLAERQRGYDTTAAGDRRADVMEPRIDDLRRDVRWAIADIQGLRRTTVELI